MAARNPAVRHAADQAVLISGTDAGHGPAHVGDGSEAAVHGAREAGENDVLDSHAVEGIVRSMIARRRRSAASRRSSPQRSRRSHHCCTGSVSGMPSTAAVGQDHRAERAGRQRADVDHPNVPQRTVVAHPQTPTNSVWLWQERTSLRV